MKKIYFALFILCTFLILPVHAQVSIPDTAKLTAQTFNVDSATEHWLNTLTPAQRAKSDAYFEGGYWLQLWSALYAIAIGCVFLLTGLSRKIKSLVNGIDVSFLQNYLYAIIYLLLSWILLFPFSVYQDFYREHQYALSNMTFGGWLQDQLIGLAILLVFGSLIVAILYAAIRVTGKA